MKKVISVFMAVLMVFCSCAIAVSAADGADEGTTVTQSEEKTTRNIKADNGMVVPINFQQLKSSFVFKIFEKIIVFILSLFNGGQAIDNGAATAIDEVASVIDERISQVDNEINAANGN